MLFSLLLTLLVANPSATAQETIDVKADLVTATKWFEANTENFKTKTGHTIVSHVGADMRIKRETLKGTFEWTERTIKVSVGNTVSYTSKLIQSHQGSLVANESRVLLEKTATGTKITLYSYTEVNDPRIKDRQLTREVDNTMRKSVEMIKAGLNRW